MAKNDDIRRLIRLYGIEWEEVAIDLRIPMKDLTRRMNGKTLSPDFRRRVIQSVQKIARRPEDFYFENRL